jgi:hypothetical protein
MPVDHLRAFSLHHSGTGTWRLASSQSGTLVQLVFTQIAKEDRRVPHRTALGVASSQQQEPSRELYYFQGERDQTSRVTFERR